MYCLPNNSVVAVHDLFDPLPEFVYRADTIFVDPPYNQALLTGFSHREGVSPSPLNTGDFGDFSARLLSCIKDIAPRHAFVEIGKEWLPDYILGLRGVYRYVTFYNSTYYRSARNKCYIVHATNEYKRRRYNELEDKDEADIVAWLCANHPFECIGDLCIGEGLVGRCAWQNGRQFVGIDLNPARLQKLVSFIQKHSRRQGAV